MIVPASLQVSISPKTSIFNLRAYGGNPEFVQAYLDAVMQEYDSLKKEMREQASDTTKSSIQEELVRLGVELQQGKQELASYQSSNSVVMLQDQGNNANSRLGALTKQLEDLKSDLALLKLLTLDENLEREEDLSQHTIIQQTRQQGASHSEPGTTQTADARNGNSTSASSDDPQGDNRTPSSLGTSESEYLHAKQTVLLSKAERAELAEFLRPKHPKMIALDEDIARKEKLLEIFRDQSQEQVTNKQHIMDLQIQNLELEIKDWEVKCLEINKKMSEYQAIKDNNLRLQTMYDNLLTSMRTLDVDKDISPESVTILEAATPGAPVPPEIGRHVGTAAMIGLALGIALLLLLDRLDDRPTSFAELEEFFDETVLGQIPLMKGKGRKGARVPVIHAEDDRHGLVEAFRNLRSAIVLSGTPENHPKTILLTSAIPGDGKSMTAANLAITIARAGSRVLLVDADMRRGALHEQFDVPSRPGLAEVLSESCTWQQAVVQTKVPNLFLLPRGKALCNPGELFLLPSKDKFLKDIAGGYDYLLFDTAPVMAADDVSNLAPRVDGVIMVVRAAYTSGRVARAALDLLYLRNVNVIGLVFNAVEADAGEYYYYKYKDYYAKFPARD